MLYVVDIQPFVCVSGCIFIYSVPIILLSSTSGNAIGMKGIDMSYRSFP